MIRSCNKCGGALIKDLEETKCLLCGYMEYNIPSDIQRDVEEAKGRNYIERFHKTPSYYHKKEDNLYGAER